VRHSKSLRTTALLGVTFLGLSVSREADAYTQLVTFDSSYDAGTIVISMRQRKLYFVLPDGRAIQYPVAVAKPGKEWLGEYFHPHWAPPSVVKHDHPELPNFIPGGSPRNPMGVAAMVLHRDQIAIHGTTARMRASIGTRASYGCIRMLNEDVADLYGRVDVGTEVVMQP